VTEREPEQGSVGARDRILEAAVRCIAREGVEGASMAAIAAQGGVSKGLLHYHYADRAHLLAETVGHLSVRIVAREQAAMVGASAGDAVNAFWALVADEIVRGELRVLLELGLQRDPAIRAAAESAAEARRVVATNTVEQLFAGLALTPRMPAPLLADASVAFVDGLVLEAWRGVGDPRVSFDIFWLALLGLGE
jgi:AcrR family transcriptional regulator